VATERHAKLPRPTPRIAYFMGHAYATPNATQNAINNGKFNYVFDTILSVTQINKRRLVSKKISRLHFSLARKC